MMVGIHREGRERGYVWREREREREGEGVEEENDKVERGSREKETTLSQGESAAKRGKYEGKHSYL